MTVGKRVLSDEWLLAWWRGLEEEVEEAGGVMEDCDDEVEEEDAVLVAILLLSWLLKVLLHWSVGYVVEPELPLQSIVQARRRCYKRKVDAGEVDRAKKV